MTGVTFTGRNCTTSSAPMACRRFPVARTQRAIQACGEWLAACLRMGWDRDKLDALEAIWWEHHDDTGKLIEPAAGVETVDTNEPTDEQITALWLESRAAAFRDPKGVPARIRFARALLARTFGVNTPDGEQR